MARLPTPGGETTVIGNVFAVTLVASLTKWCCLGAGLGF